MTACVYWIRKPEHTDILSEGYVGVTKQAIERRFSQHIRSARKKSKDKQHLCTFFKALLKYDDLIISKIVVGNYDYILDIERKLRPIKRVGWNVMRGGGDKPKTTSFGEAHIRGIKSFYENNPHPLSLVNPWDIAAASTTYPLWEKAPFIVECIEKGIGDSKISKLLGFTSRITTVRTIRRMMVNNNWHPHKDPEWVKRFEVSTNEES